MTEQPKGTDRAERVEPWMTVAAQKLLDSEYGAEAGFDASEISDWAEIIAEALRIPLPEQPPRGNLADLAKEMGDAGYCNYEACLSFLLRAYRIGYDGVWDARVSDKPMSYQEYHVKAGASSNVDRVGKER